MTGGTSHGWKEKGQLLQHPTKDLPKEADPGEAPGKQTVITGRVNEDRRATL